MYTLNCVFIFILLLEYIWHIHSEILVSRLYTLKQATTKKENLLTNTVLTFNITLVPYARYGMTYCTV